MTEKQCFVILTNITKHCFILGGGLVTISKKELLNLTGISYGQLYRWKREGLIPEEWFMKQPSFTGQETFLPRDLVLERIRFILEKKDSCSLEEIREMLVTAPDKKELTWERLAELEEIDLEIAGLVRKEEYSYLEVGWLAALSDYRRKYQLSIEQAAELCQGSRGLLEKMGKEGTFFLIFQAGQTYYGACCENNKVVMEERIGQVEWYLLTKWAGKMKEKFL